MAKKESGIVNIKGKDYQTVAYRVTSFRHEYPQYALTTEVLFRDESEVVMKATIANEEGRILATGHGEEQRKSSHINKTSALENCETSAIGRALAAFGLGGTEFASANEVQNAIHQQKAPLITEAQALAKVKAANNATALNKTAREMKKDCERDLSLDEYARVKKAIEDKLTEFRQAVAV